MIKRPRDTSVSLAVDLGGITMKNPVTTASGCFASGREYSEFVDIASLGAVTTKGVSLHAWEGSATPRIAETPSGLLNCIGLQNPGVEYFKANDLPWLIDKGACVIVNVSGHTIDEYIGVIESLNSSGVAGYEINISCPNVDSGGMAFGSDSHKAASVIAACRAATTRPLLVKLTPNVGDIAEVARAVEASGADAVSLINTVLGMAIDIHSRRPRLARIVGGLSGPAIKPIALRMVWEVSRAVSLPILGIGGIASGTDAVEFLLAGASAVAVGTANFSNPVASIDVIDGIISYCEENAVGDVHELIGSLQC